MCHGCMESVSLCSCVVCLVTVLIFNSIMQKQNQQNKDYRLCPNCHLHKVEDEEHFLIECPKYEEERKSLFESASKLSIHFNDLSNYYTFIWKMSNENETLNELGIYLTIASEKQALSYL